MYHRAEKSCWRQCYYLWRMGTDQYSLLERYSASFTLLPVSVHFGWGKNKTWDRSYTVWAFLCMEKSPWRRRDIYASFCGNPDHDSRSVCAGAFSGDIQRLYLFSGQYLWQRRERNRMPLSSVFCYKIIEAEHCKISYAKEQKRRHIFWSDGMWENLYHGISCPPACTSLYRNSANRIADNHLDCWPGWTAKAGCQAFYKEYRISESWRSVCCERQSAVKGGTWSTAKWWVLYLYDPEVLRP